MILLKGQMITSLSNNQNNKVVKFDQMNLNLGTLENNVIKKPKIQETSTAQLLNCFTNKYKKNSFCTISSKKELIPILNRRIVLPFYIPIISLLCSLLLINSKNKVFINKISIFLSAFFVLLFAELFIRYTGLNLLINYLFILFPFMFLPFMYFVLIQKFKKEIVYQ